MPSTATPMQWLTAAVVLAVLSYGDAAKILGMLPYRGWSHFSAFQPLLIELARRGHEVTVLCPFKAPQDAPKSYKVIPFEYESTIIGDSNLNADIIYDGSYSFMRVKILEKLSEELCNSGLRQPGVKQLLNSKEQFDLIFVEVFQTDCFLGFMHKFKAPVIGLSSHTMMPWANERTGTPASLAFAPNIFLALTEEMSLFERVRNTVEYFWSLWYFKWYESERQKLVKETFGADTPDTAEMAGKFELLLVNSHESVHMARPLPPSVINVAGMHLPKPQPISEDLGSFLDGAQHGVVYFNMGSLLRGESLSKEKVTALLKAFGQLKQRVLWKWEGTPPANAPLNVKFLPWVRQFDVLQHPKVKLFISHGGMLGTTEAVHSGIPLIVIPMFGDQHHNAAALVYRGLARLLPYSDLLYSDKILEAVRDVLENPKYAETAKKTSAAFRDRPLPPLEMAVYWSEYVIRHKGARHFRQASIDMPYYQLLLLDVLLVLLAPPVLLWVVIRRCCCNGSDKIKSKRD